MTHHWLAILLLGLFLATASLEVWERRKFAKSVPPPPELSQEEEASVTLQEKKVPLPPKRQQKPRKSLLHESCVTKSVEVFQGSPSAVQQKKISKSQRSPCPVLSSSQKPDESSSPPQGLRLPRTLRRRAEEILPEEDSERHRLNPLAECGESQSLSTPPPLIKKTEIPEEFSEEPSSRLSSLVESDSEVVSEEEESVDSLVSPDPHFKLEGITTLVSIGDEDLGGSHSSLAQDSDEEVHDLEKSEPVGLMPHNTQKKDCFDDE